MNKKLLSLLLFVMAAFTAAFAQETVTVYDGTNTSSYVPVYGTWADAYNKCEFIMNADQLGDLPIGSTITGVKWYLNAAAAKAWGGNFQIFIKEVDATSLSDFTGTDGATVVWTGALDGTSGYVDLEFNQYYTYNGGNLLIGVYQIAKGTYTTTAFLGVGTEGASVSGYSSSSLDAIAATQRNFVPKTTFTYSTGKVYDKPKNLVISNITPNSAKLTWEAGGTETSWAVEYKKATEETWTQTDPVTLSSTTITLDGLTNGAAYDVRVKAVLADGESGWLPGTFTTPACEASDMGEITYELTDTYGDGWNGNKLQIVYNGTVIEELTLNSGGKDEPITGTVALCYGVNYDLVWVAGSYGYETGFTITGPDGSVIYEFHGTGTSSGGSPTAGTLTTFHISQVTCPRPTNLAASNIVYNGAKLTWTPGDEEQDAWEVIYAEGTPAANAIEMVPIAVNGTPEKEISLEENKTYTAYVRGNCGENNKSNWSDGVTFTTPLQFPLPTELAVSDITATTAKATWSGDTEKYNIRYRTAAGKEMIYSNDLEEGAPGWTNSDEDGDGDNWQLVNLSSSTTLSAHSGNIVFYSRSYSSGTNLSPDNWLISPQVDLKGTLKYYVAGDGSWPETYRIYVSTTGTDVEDFEPLTDDMQTPSTSMVYEEKTFDLSTYEGVKGYIAFRHYNCTGQDFMLIDDISIEGADFAAGEWIVKNEVTSGYVMGEDNDPALTLNTQYEVQVQGVYTDATSQWTESVLFTTTDGLDMPTNLAVTEITDKSAKASWDGSQDSYNLRYRKAAQADIKFFEGFENGLDAWTLVDSDGDGNNWMQFNPQNFSEGGFPAYEGQYAAMSRSWQSSALTPDQWMISPEIEDLGGTLRYYIVDDGANYQETYRIYVCTTGSTDIADFEPVTDDMLSPNSVEWTEVEIDLSAYAGQSGRIAFRHYDCTDKDFMLIDAIGIYANEVPASEWITIEDITSPYVMGTGENEQPLDPNTDYEVQVQGIFNGTTTDWTDLVQFTTLEAQEPEPVITLDVEFGTYNEAQTVHVTVENMPDGGSVKYQFVAAPEPEGINMMADGEWMDYDDATGIAVDKSGALTVAVFDAGGEKLAEVTGEYTIDVNTGIDNIYVDKNNNDWYNLNGQKLSGKPTTPGIYINGNKKVVIK